MRLRLWIVIALVLVMLVPNVAYAEDREPSIESVEIEQSDRGILGASPITPLSLIRSFFTNVKLTFGSTYALVNIHMHLKAFLTNNRLQAMFMIPAVIIVFGWWGVRKVIRMLFRAFRRGKANV